jgi:ElaB/YqjD/DUF883 family membrane-anchored ribosome-binding protein
MKKISYLTSAFAVAALASTAPASAGDLRKLGRAINRVVIDGGKTGEKALHDAGHTGEKALHDAGRTGEKALHDIGNSGEKALHDVGHTGEKALHDTGKTLEKAAQDTGRALEKAAHDTGHALEAAGQFIKDHPWETVIAVALIAGGGYLILYEGYALCVTVEGVNIVTITSGAASGIAVGSTLTAAGIGTIALGFYMGGPRSDPATDGGQPFSSRTSPDGSREISVGQPSLGAPPFGSPTLKLTYTPHEAPHRAVVYQQPEHPRVVTGNPRPTETGRQTTPASGPGKAIEPVVVSHYSRSVMFEPRLAKSPSDMQRYSYANWVNSWAEKTLPLEKFDPDSPYTVSDVELKILDAITTLKPIRDSEDEQAEDQRSERINPLPQLAQDQAFETSKEIWWSLLKHEDAREVFTLAKQLEILGGANAPGPGKLLLMAGAPEVAGMMGAIGVMNVGTAYGVLLSSTATSEGLKQSSDNLAAQLWSKLNAYSDKREKKFSRPQDRNKIPMQTVTKEPHGALVKPAP